MNTHGNIDHGRPFDWGRTAAAYAQYRDIYPAAFYQAIIEKNIGISGQRVLDLGTGTGVLPRQLYRCGAEWTGVDCSAAQIAQAQRLAAEQDMKIQFLVSAAEDISFPSGSFDAVTACQCHWYFDYAKLLPVLADVLKPDGRFLLMCMEWLPQEDAVAQASESLVLQYNPQWSGANETRKPIALPAGADAYFTVESRTLFDLAVPFTRETWHGRMTACRGIGASLDDDSLAAWDKAHRAMLQSIASESFMVLHFAAMTELRVKK